ncbi:MAG: FtsQ-type POTRA domain-containing protein [Flavobacteriales bacterium]|nr:FtsQ-type POTRA domain-containing protein [Flavobacteriales bacterium]
MRKFLQIATWIILIAGVIAALGFVNKKHTMQTFTTPEVDIDYETENRFVDEQDILRQVLGKADTGVLLLSRFDVNYLEEKLGNNSSIKDVQVYKTIDGKLKIKVKQRRPILRVFSETDSYYIDEFGNLMLCSPKYTSRLTVASGYLNEPYNKRYQLNYRELPDSIAEKTLLDDIYRIANYIDQSEFWKAQIEQIYVNKVSDIELVPKVGNHKIVFGGVENLESKFEKLMLFYQKGLSKTGWNEYSEINLKYKNQVVCTKRYIE